LTVRPARQDAVYLHHMTARALETTRQHPHSGRLWITLGPQRGARGSWEIVKQLLKCQQGFEEEKRQC